MTTRGHYYNTSFLWLSFKKKLKNITLARGCELQPGAEGSSSRDLVEVLLTSVGDGVSVGRDRGSHTAEVARCLAGLLAALGTNPGTSGV